MTNLGITPLLRCILSRFMTTGFLSVACISNFHAAPEPATRGKTDTPDGNSSQSTVSRADITNLQDLIIQQHQAIEDLKARVAQQQALIDKLILERKVDPSAAPNSGSPVEVASLSADPPQSANNSGAQANSNVVAAKKDEKKSEEKPFGNALSINGFRFSGDFRFRLDVQARSGNDIAPPLQNVRSRYRVRLNVDKEMDPKFNVHVQVSTGPYSVGTTNDQDMAGTIAKSPFSLAEAYVDYHPNKQFSIRGGRMEEAFADIKRFLWDDDVRFNGFQQIARIPLNSDNSLEFRAGEYWLSNPNIAILPANSPYVMAGYLPGQKVRDANLFNPGIILNLSKGGPWKQKIISDVLVFRNPNQIQLASTAIGFPVVVNPALGLNLSGPMSASGNATTAPGGAIYTAPDFHIVRTAYRVEYSGLKLASREMPFWFDVEVARNYGAGFLRDSVMGTVNLGAVKKAGDLGFLYQYSIKDANSIISQLTDDDLGTGTGVNIAVHAIRMDIGITRFLTWENLLFIQNERRSNNPSDLFFVPLQRGANTTFRYLGQLAFTF